ncbi:MAG: hypothetical protein ABJF23_31255 [Bryobacteraceae bacterium]
MAEMFVSFLLPGSCRDEVLGDLYERYKGPLQYAADVIFTVPLVIASKIRRRSDPQTALIEVMTMYLVYGAAAWFVDRSYLRTGSALLRLAIPPAATMGLFALWDVYTTSRRKPVLCVALGGLFAIGSVPIEILACGVLMIAAFVVIILLMFPRFLGWHR